MTLLERLEASFAQLGLLLPALFGGLIILFAGYLLARLVQRGTERLLRRIQLNQLLERGGVLQVVERSGSHANPTRVVANLLFWIIMFAVILVAADALGLDLTAVFSELVGYIPGVIAAIVVIIVGILLGEFVGALVAASAGGLHSGPTLARVARIGVIVISVFMALQTLGVAPNIVTTAFAILFGAAAFALAIAFGLGNRELAGRVTRDWYERYQAERAAIERETAEQDEADRIAEEEAERAAEARRAARRTPRGSPLPPGVTPLGTPTVPAPGTPEAPGAPGAPAGQAPGTPADRRS